MPSSMTSEKLKKLTNQIIDTITSEEFVARMNAMRTAPIDERVETAQKLLSVDGLRAAGVEMPEAMRVSSRYFEQEVGTFEFGNVEVVEEIGRSDPDFLKRLKVERPEIHARLVADWSKQPALSCTLASGAVVMGMCGGAGAGTVCACGGSC